MVVSKTKSEKITLTIPSELKAQLTALKDELHLSASAIYKEALEAYLQQKELERWEKAAYMASQDKAYMAFVEEMGNVVDDIHEY